jgi:putative transposase
MPRANRYHLCGYLWHITHRCHRKQFLLKFAKDRRNWLAWLYEARKRYGLCVLDYTVTCNHIHLLVRDLGRGEIAASMQLIAGRTGQAYNRRKVRRGAYWEDRYHATAVDSGQHLLRCLTYIDLNMVRAAVVAHPQQWENGGYHEIQQPRVRYRIVDREALAELVECGGVSRLAAAHAQSIADALRRRELERQVHWAESLAVGRAEFVERVANDLGARAQYRQIEQSGDLYVLREAASPYGPIPGTKRAS